MRIHLDLGIWGNSSLRRRASSIIILSFGWLGIILHNRFSFVVLNLFTDAIGIKLTKYS